jgi:hypothetical protein
MRKAMGRYLGDFGRGYRLFQANDGPDRRFLYIPVRAGMKVGPYGFNGAQQAEQRQKSQQIVGFEADQAMVGPGVTHAEAPC